MTPDEKASSARPAVCLEFSLIEYREAWALQAKLVDFRKSGHLDRDVFMIVEHSRVFTLGRRGGIENLTVPESFLKSSGIPVVHVERGGNITFHGPGQIVVYPIVDLRAARLGVVEFVSCLEDIMIRTASDWGIAAGRNPINRGVWIGRDKLGSVGIAVRRGISFHGLALNVNLPLHPFEWINPCGLQGVGVTSMEQASGRRIAMNRVREAVKKHIESVFSVALSIRNITDLGI